MYQQLTVKKQTAVIDGVNSLVLDAPAIAAAAQPGQFLMLKAWETKVPFLMRPMSINSADPKGGSLTLLYRVVGQGTAIMADLTAGDTLTVLGPLGHGFPLPEEGRRIAVIGRGMGIAPLRFLVEVAVARGMEVYAYLSGKRPEEIFHKDHFAALGAKVTVSTDENKRVTDAFARDAASLPFDAAYCCGSKRLASHMKALHGQYGFPAYVSLEERMACGVGACKGCACKTLPENGQPPEYALVCKHGPVFPVESVIQ